MVPKKDDKKEVKKEEKKLETKTMITANLDKYFFQVKQEPKSTRWARAIDLLIAENGGADKFVCALEIKGQKYFTFKV